MICLYQFLHSWLSGILSLSHSSSSSSFPPLVLLLLLLCLLLLLRRLLLLLLLRLLLLLLHWHTVPHSLRVPPSERQPKQICLLLSSSIAWNRSVSDYPSPVQSSHHTFGIAVTWKAKTIFPTTAMLLLMLMSHPNTPQVKFAPSPPKIMSWPTISSTIQRRKVYKRCEKFITNCHYKKREAKVNNNPSIHILKNSYVLYYIFYILYFHVIRKQWL